LEGILEKDIRIKNAKARLQERGMKLKAGGGATTDDTNTKRRRLDDLEDQAMAEEDPEKLKKIFEEYRREYIKARDDSNEEETKRARTAGPQPLRAD
jgi:hypothetical protein